MRALTQYQLCLQGKHKFVTPQRLPDGSVATWGNTTRAICGTCGKVRVHQIGGSMARYEDWPSRLTEEYRDYLAQH